MNRDDHSVLQQDITIIEQWSENQMLLKVHPDKCRHMEIGKNNKGENKYFIQQCYKNKTYVKNKDLGVTVDFKLIFQTYI